jgi:vacuolar-type H+-ATPase subunit C/Vma6
MRAKTYDYDKDLYAWASHNVKLMRQGRLTEVDMEHVAQEIEDMGNNNKRELVSRLAVLYAHLLKWQFQPRKRSKSWERTINLQRMSLQLLLKQSPSLKHHIKETLDKAYEQAVLLAANETGLDESTFPTDCPFNLSLALDKAFFPDGLKHA